MEKKNDERESITIRITGKEINMRLTALERLTSRLTYIQYFQTALLLILIGKLFVL